MKFVKKPVSDKVEAIQFDGLDSYFSILAWMKASGDTHALADEIRFSTPIMLIYTREGTTPVSPRDWVVKDEFGAFHVCKPDVFEKTYESAVNTHTL